MYYYNTIMNRSASGHEYVSLIYEAVIFHNSMKLNDDDRRRTSEMRRNSCVFHWGIRNHAHIYYMIIIISVVALTER